jgi:hypothetical protein
MTIALGILIYFTVYFAIGWRLAIRDMPRLWAEQRSEHPILNDRFHKSEVKERAVFMVLFWPIRVPLLAANRALTGLVDAHDPREQEKRVRDQALRIRELEHELGITK